MLMPPHQLEDILRLKKWVVLQKDPGKFPMYCKKSAKLKRMNSVNWLQHVHEKMD
jgi:hypothetical protein